MAEPDPELDAATPRVLLFGHSGSGKSSLLAALVRAGETQGEALQGDVQEASGRLAAIKDAVYRGDPLAKSDTELTSYTIRLRPWRIGPVTVGESRTVILHDCSGRAAESLIRHPSSLHDPDTRAAVARAVVESDAILLLVDANSNDDEFQEAFEEFDTFLTVVAQAKAMAREVGGFPIYLVLTKCDGLAVPLDTRERWEARVRERAEHAWRQFDAHLKDADPDDEVPSPFLPFGSIDLSVFTVAIRQPVFAESAAAAQTPYGVAELFRDCFSTARVHHDRALHSNRRLTWTVRAAVALVVVMFLGAVSITLFPPHRGDLGLADRVRGYREHEPIAAKRLSDSELGKNRRLLSEFRDDAAFHSLPEDAKAFVFDRLREIDNYERYRARLYTAIAPGDTRTVEDLARVVESLERGELGLPTLAWEGTSAAQLRDKWLADARAIRRAEVQFQERYQNLVRRGTALTLAGSFGGNWRADITALFGEAAQPPAPLGELLPDSPVLDQPRGRAVPNRVPFEFAPVYEARRDWGYTQNRLARMRDLADALGLTEGEGRPESALVLPDPGRRVNSETLPGSRLFALRHIPRDEPEVRDWGIASFPDPGRTNLAAGLDRAFGAGSRHAIALLNARQGDNPAAKDTPEGWRALADALIDPAFADWGRLLHFIDRLRDPAAVNPIVELAAFLRADRFEIEPSGFTLRIPGDLSLDKVIPAGALELTVTGNGKPAERLRFKQAGAAERDGSATRFQFQPEQKARLAYAPGQEFRAELPVRAGSQEFKLVWASAGSRTYQFDALVREPRVVKPTGMEPATGVTLTPHPGSTLPRLPALFPGVKK